MPNSCRQERERHCAPGSHWNSRSAAAVLIQVKIAAGHVQLEIERRRPNTKPKLRQPPTATEPWGSSTFLFLAGARGPHADRRRFDSADLDPSPAPSELPLQVLVKLVCSIHAMEAGFGARWRRGQTLLSHQRMPAALLPFHKAPIRRKTGQFGHPTFLHVPARATCRKQFPIQPRSALVQYHLHKQAHSRRRWIRPPAGGLCPPLTLLHRNPRSWLRRGL